MRRARTGSPMQFKRTSPLRYELLKMAEPSSSRGQVVDSRILRIERTIAAAYAKHLLATYSVAQVAIALQVEESFVEAIALGRTFRKLRPLQPPDYILHRR